MTTKPTLNQILTDLLAGKPLERPLSGGRMLLYKEPDADSPTYRLFCYRRGETPPSTTEFGTVRRELERLLPGRQISLDRYNRSYTGSDSVPRTGRVFSWQPEPPVQAALDLDMSQPVRYE